MRLPLSQLRATFRVVWVVKELVKAQDVRERRNMEQGVDQRWTRGAWPPARVRQWLNRFRSDNIIFSGITHARHQTVALFNPTQLNPTPSASFVQPDLA